MFCPSTIIPCLSLLLCGELSHLPQVSHVLWDPLPPVTDQETVEAELAFARRPPQIVEALMGRQCGVLKLPGRHSLGVNTTWCPSYKLQFLVKMRPSLSNLSHCRVPGSGVRIMN